MPSIDKLKQQLAEVEAELVKVRKRIRPLADRVDELRDERDGLRHKITLEQRRQQLTQLIGQPVKTSSILSRHSKLAWLNSSTGVLQSIGRTHCCVDYGTRGEWRLPISGLQPVDEPRATCELEALEDGSDLSEMGL